MAFLELSFYANTLRSWGLALLVALATFFAPRSVRVIVHRNLQRLARRTRTDLDDIVAAVLGCTRAWFLVLLSVWAGSLLLVFPDRVRALLGSVAVLGTLVQVGLGATPPCAPTCTATRSARGPGRRQRHERPRPRLHRQPGALGPRLPAVLDNLGIDVTAMVAGLGVGGVAVALAVQNILGDLFASLSIVLDKPFVYGDFIIVGDLLGTVEQVGLKTTRCGASPASSSSSPTPTC